MATKSIYKLDNERITSDSIVHQCEDDSYKNLKEYLKEYLKPSQLYEMLKEYIKPVVLFNNASGTNSTITLSDSATNYEYIEIIFRNNDNSYQSTGKLYNANGHTIYLISVGVNSSGKSWLKATEVTLNGNKITFSNNYSEITLANNSSVSISHTNTNYITRVLGYK